MHALTGLLIKDFFVRTLPVTPARTAAAYTCTGRPLTRSKYVRAEAWARPTTSGVEEEEEEEEEEEAAKGA